MGILVKESGSISGINVSSPSAADRSCLDEGLLGRRALGRRAPHREQSDIMLCTKGTCHCSDLVLSDSACILQKTCQLNLGGVLILP